MVTVRVSGAQLRQRFDGCQPDFVANVCHGMCCCPTKGPAMPVIVVARIGAGTWRRTPGEDDIRITRDALCPHFVDYRCGLHGDPEKPMGCLVAPFYISEHGLLGVRNRYRRFPCFNGGARLPAYVAFRSGLDSIFGREAAQGVADAAEAGVGIFTAEIPDGAYAALKEVQRIESSPWVR